MRDKPYIRWAYPNEGSLIQSILQSDQNALAGLVDWSLPLGPFWLVAFLGMEPVGCINVHQGHPIGRMEYLIVNPHLAKRQKAILSRDLCYAGIAVPKQGGSQMLATYINDTDIGWKHVIERRHSIPMDHGTLYMRKV